MATQLFGYLSVRDWKTRLVFWAGALAVGLAAAVFAIASNRVMALHDRIIEQSKWWSLLVSSLILVLMVFCTLYSSPGTQQSGIPHACAALLRSNYSVSPRLLSFRSSFVK